VSDDGSGSQPRHQRSAPTNTTPMTRTPGRRERTRVNLGHPGQLVGRLKYSVQTSTYRPSTQLRPYCQSTTCPAAQIRRTSPDQLRPQKPVHVSSLKDSPH
jgi:hypothetical protein